MDRGRYYWVKRVPKRFRGVVLGVSGRPVQQLRVALNTDSKTVALQKSAIIEAAKLAEWEALASSDPGSARQHFLVAQKLAQSRGFPYKPFSELLTGPIDDLAEWLISLENAIDKPVVLDAVLGLSGVVLPDLAGVLKEYIDLTRHRHLKKSDGQRHRWALPRQRAVKNFLTVMGPDAARPVDEISRADALKFRAWWFDRVANGMAPGSANKDFTHLAEIWNTWTTLTSHDLPNPFAKMALANESETSRPPFSRQWVAERLLAPHIFDQLNAEARDIFLMMVNTGIRPSEVTDAPLTDFYLQEDIPFLRIAPHGRELKVKHTRRDIPLLGVSLAAAQRIMERGGIQRYAGKAGGWSAVTNKYLLNNGLKETLSHTAYSLRHYVEDELLAAGVDDRIRADILGHKYHRPNYGQGGGLLGRYGALMKIAL